MSNNVKKATANPLKQIAQELTEKKDRPRPNTQTYIQKIPHIQYLYFIQDASETPWRRLRSDNECPVKTLKSDA